MNDQPSRTPNILLLSNDVQRREAWGRALESLRSNLSFRSLSECEPLAWDVIVTDSRVPLPDQTNPRPGGSTGIVSVGGSVPTDVWLPADCSDRELLLACELLLRIVVLRRQLRSQMREQKALTEQALTDPVTGLPNRRAWDRTLTSKLEERRDAPSCLAVIDLDRFKQINDDAGYVIGDQVLREVGKELLATTRRGDLAARLGGDEFAVLMLDLEPDRALAVVDRVRQAVGQAIARAGAATTASAGLAIERPGTAITAEEFLGAADRALRQAKRLGRDRTVMSADQSTD